jgi:ATP-dependent DNA ligase
VPAFHRGDGHRFLEATRDRRLEGVVAKRLDGRYYF